MFPGSRIMGLFVVLYAALFTVAAMGELEYNFSEIVAEEGVIKVTARVRNIVDDHCSYTERWLGGYAQSAIGIGKCPVAVMDKLEITYKGDLVHVPAVSYNDLVDIGEILIQEGDGDAYTVVIETGMKQEVVVSLGFVGKILVDRFVRSGTHWQHQYGIKGRTEYVFDAESGEYTAITPEDAYYEISDENSPHKLKVSAIIRKNSTGNCNDSDIPWGGGDLCPRNQIEKLVVSYARYVDSDVHIPVSAYSDLASVSSISISFIESSSDMYVVYIKGGDAGISYEAFLYFEGNHLARRIVWSPLFPTHTKEEIEYDYR